MVWAISYDERSLLNADEEGEIRLLVPITFHLGAIPRFFKPHFIFYRPEMPGDCGCLLLRDSTGFKRMGEGRETPAQRKDYLTLIGYATHEVPRLSDDIAQRVVIQGDSYGEIREGADCMRGELDNFQFDVSRGLYRAIRKAIETSPVLTPREKVKATRKTWELKELVCA